MASLRIGLLVLGGGLWAAASASADVVMLKNGGQVRGQLQSAEDAPVVIVSTLLGGTVSIEQSAIENIERRSPLIEEYESRARDVDDTVDARWSLAEWCKANGLRDQQRSSCRCCSTSIRIMRTPGESSGTCCTTASG